MKNPAYIYKGADACGNVAKMYIEKGNDNDSLIVITRDEIITACKSGMRYVGRKKRLEESFMNERDKEIVFWPATYDLDDDVPAIDIGFKWIHNAMYVDEIELPKETKSTIMLERNSNDEIGKIQVVDPDNFLAAKCTDNIEVNGYNVKQLVREALDYFQKADNPYENVYL